MTSTSRQLNISCDGKSICDTRPALKRQATAPAPLRSHFAKKVRYAVEDERGMWSEDVHAAFLEGICTLNEHATHDNLKAYFLYP